MLTKVLTKPLFKVIIFIQLSKYIIFSTFKNHKIQINKGFKKNYL